MLMITLYAEQKKKKRRHRCIDVHAAWDGLLHKGSLQSTHPHCLSRSVRGEISKV